MRRFRKRCRHCLGLIASDGYGEPVHIESNRYQCEDGETVAE
jgi:hypothetical protein